MSPMKYAAGLVVYRVPTQGPVQYLLLKASYPPFHWTPPKGHVDQGETDHLVTALRETQEEAGLSKTDLDVHDFKVVINYDVNRKPKEVTYWLAKQTSTKEVALSDEHTEFVWTDCEEAVKLIGFPSTGDVIRQCEKFISTR